VNVKFILEELYQFNCRGKNRSPSFVIPSMFTLEILSGHGWQFVTPGQATDINTRYFYPVFIRQPIHELFNDVEGPDILSYVDAGILERIRNGSVQLVFANIEECFDFWYADWIGPYHKCLEKYQIPVQHVHWVLASDRTNYTGGNQHLYNFYIANISQCLRETEFRLPDKPRFTKHFISLNHQPRQHRYLLCCGMYDKGLHHKAVISCRDFDIDNCHQDGNLQLQTLALAQRHYSADLLSDFRSSLPWIADHLPDARNCVYNMNGHPDYHINLSYHCAADVVTETQSSGPVMICEKTLRPIRFKQPFLIAGNQHFYKYLRSFGFVTFPELFDENFDDIADMPTRVNAILDTLDDFCQRDLDDLHQLITTDLQEKLDHNHDLLASIDWYARLCDSLIADK
jgi:hypothetical protein